MLNFTVISTRGRDLDLLRYKISPSGRDDSKTKVVFILRISMQRSHLIDHVGLVHIAVTHTRKVSYH